MSTRAVCLDSVNVDTCPIPFAVIGVFKRRRTQQSSQNRLSPRQSPQAKPSGNPDHKICMESDQLLHHWLQHLSVSRETWQLAAGIAISLGFPTCGGLAPDCPFGPPEFTMSQNTPLRPPQGGLGSGRQYESPHLTLLLSDPTKASHSHAPSSSKRPRPTPQSLQRLPATA